MCARLIGSELDHRPTKRAERVLASRATSPCLRRPAADLWRYEEALESAGIPVATQAGKGLFRRQEIQDLIALTRVLADGATPWRSARCCAGRWSD